MLEIEEIDELKLKGKRSLVGKICADSVIGKEL